MTVELERISYRLLTDQEIAARAHLKITSPFMYNENKTIKEKGVLDLTLGSDSSDVFCSTCSLVGGRCMGHEGVLELALPVPNPGLRNLLKSFLKRVCVNCKRCSNVKNRCQLCKEPNKYVMATPYSVKRNNVLLGPTELYETMRAIPPEDYSKLLQFKYHTPKDLFMNNLLVPSISIRPSGSYKGKKSVDDLSKKLQSICQVNEKLKKIIQANYLEKIKLQIYNLLCYEIFTYFDNKVLGLPVSTDRGGKATRSLMDLIQSKEGLFRANLRGKRTEYASRCVITADSTLELGQVGVPLKIARTLTKPVMVTKYNLDQVRKWLSSSDYVSVKYYEHKREDQGYLKLKVLDSNRQMILSSLSQGDRVHRDLKTGDYVGFNRQPTIHRYGFMGHRVVVYENETTEGLTLRMNPSSCLPYNADFDGDQMTIYVPQTQGSELDLRMFMAVKNNYIDNKNRHPLFGATKQLLTAAYHLSTTNQTFSRPVAVSLMRENFVPTPNKTSYTGRDLISMCLVKGFYFKQNDSPEGILIEDGRFVKGHLTKTNFSQSSMFSQKLVVYSGTKYWEILNKLLTLLRSYYKYVGHSVSYKDYQLDPDLQSKIDSLKQRYVNYFEKNYSKQRTPQFLKKVSKNYQLQSHKEIQKILDSVKETPPLQMARAGSSGSMTNLIQILNVVGARNVQGLPPRKYFQNLYPTFTGSNLNCELYKEGLIWNNYKDGLSYLDFVNDAMYSRDSTIINQLKITTMGYFSRRLLCALADLYIDENNFVRDGKNKIVQYKVGGNGIDLDQYKPNVINPDLKAKIVNQEFKEASDSSKVIEDPKSYLNKYYDELYYNVIKTNSEQSKKFTAQQLDRCAGSMFIPYGSPIGMATGHAITEPSVQLTLSAKHNLTGEQSTFQKLVSLVDRSFKVPLIILKLGNKQRYQQIYDKILPKKLKQCAVLRYSMDPLCVELKDVKEEVLQRVLVHLKAQFKGKFEVQVENDTCKLVPETRTLRTLDQMYRCIQDQIVLGNKHIKYYIQKSDQNRILIYGTKGSASLYNSVVDLVKKKLLTEQQVEFKDPVYLQTKKGIELARKLLYKQLSLFLNQGISIDPRYFSIFCDLVSQSGNLVSSTREGLMKLKVPLTRAAYEATKTVVYKIALSREEDYLKSPISSIIVGKPLSIGVNFPKLYL